MMFLKNYTSAVPVSETIRKIEAVLIRCGVSGITKEYGPQANVSALRFEIAIPGSSTVNIRLPVDRDRALEALWANYVNDDDLSPDGGELAWGSQKRKKKSDFKDQAERTAWKIVQDWVEVQMSMIQLKQADFVEVFLPYVWDGRSTVYSRIKAADYRALLPERSENPH